MKLNRRTVIVALICLALLSTFLLAGCTRPKPAASPTSQPTATPTSALPAPAATAAPGTPGATAPAQLTPATAATATPLPSALPPLPTAEPTAPVPEATATPAPAESTYTVQAGDTLYGLALRFGTTVNELAALNGISADALLSVGQVLQIPSEATAPPNVHIVQAGETLFRIALRYGTTWQTLAQLNGIADPNTLYVGQRIVLPSGASGQPQATPGATKTYVVQPGDTLYGLSRTFGVTVEALANANGLTLISLLYVGQTLTIP